MASNGEEELKRRIIQAFIEKGTRIDGNIIELPLKDICRAVGAEKKAINKILHHTPACFTKVKDSPPLWRYKADQSSTTAVAGSASNVTVATEPDVVVKKKVEVESPSKKERLKPDILRVLKESSVPMTALQIAKKTGCESAGDVNPTLYALKDEEKVTKSSDNKWTIKYNIPNMSSLSAATGDLHITPMKLGDKELYTKEEVIEDGRKEFRFREVLTEDVLPKKVEASDETDMSRQPDLASTQLDPEMLALLSSLYDDPGESDLALKIVSLLKASPDTPLDDTDIYTKLGLSTRLETRPVLDSLVLNGLIERIDGDVIKWKWKTS